MSTAPAMTAAPSAPAAASTPSTTSSAPTPATNSSPPSGTAAPTSGSAPANTGSTKPAGTTDQTPPGSEAAKVAEAVRKHKLKVNGKEMELDEPEVLRRAQLAEAADQRFQEAANQRKEINAVLEMLKADPAGAMAKLGMNPREFAETFLAGELRKEMLSPEQKELADLRAKNAKWEQEQKTTTERAAEQAKQQVMREQETRAAAEYDKTITEVLASTNLPKTPETVKRVASMLKNALNSGYELDVPTAVDMVKQGYMGDVQALFGGLKGEALVKMLGDSIAKEIRQYDLGRIKAKLNMPPTDPAAPVAANARQSATPPKGLNQEQWLEEVRRKAGL